MVPYILKKYATSQERDLKGLDVDVGVEGVPGVRPNAVRDKCGEETIEVEEEEDGSVQALAKEAQDKVAYSSQDAANQQLN
jgi:hypothetical protein